MPMLLREAEGHRERGAIRHSSDPARSETLYTSGDPSSTIRCRTAGEYFVAVLMAPSSQRLEPPENPRRLTPPSVILVPLADVSSFCCFLRRPTEAHLGGFRLAHGHLKRVFDFGSRLRPDVSSIKPVH